MNSKAWCSNAFEADRPLYSAGRLVRMLQGPRNRLLDCLRIREKQPTKQSFPLIDLQACEQWKRMKIPNKSEYPKGTPPATGSAANKIVSDGPRGDSHETQDPHQGGHAAERCQAVDQLSGMGWFGSARGIGKQPTIWIRLYDFGGMTVEHEPFQ